MILLMKSWMMKLLGLPSCEEIERFAYDYLDDRLDRDIVAKFEKHLRGCRNCDSFVRTYRAVARPDKLAGGVPLDPDFEGRVIAYLKENA